MSQLRRRAFLRGLAAATVATPATAANPVRTRTQTVATGATLPATALAQIQANIDTNGYCEIGYSSSIQQLAGQILLGSNQRLIISREAALQWTSALGDNPAISNRTTSPANLAAYDIGPAVLGGGRLLGPWNGSSAGTQNQHAIQWLACRNPRVDVLVDGWQGDGVYHGNKSGTASLYTYGSKVRIVGSNLLRNVCTFVSGEGFDLDVYGTTGVGLQVLDLEGNTGCIIQDGRFVARGDAGGGGPLGGASYIVAASDKNGSTVQNVTGRVIGRGFNGGGLYYRGVLGLICEIDVENLGGHGITGGNGAARASRVTLSADISVKPGTSFNGWVDTSENSIVETLSMKVRQPNNVNPIAIRTAAGGTYAGLDVTMSGTGSACINLDHCTDVELIAPRMAGGTYAVEFDSTHGNSTHNKIRGGTFINQTVGCMREVVAGGDFNKAYDPDTEGATEGFTWLGANSGKFARP